MSQGLALLLLLEADASVGLTKTTSASRPARHESLNSFGRTVLLQEHEDVAQSYLGEKVDARETDTAAEPEPFSHWCCLSAALAQSRRFDPSLSLLSHAHRTSRPRCFNVEGHLIATTNSRNGTFS